MKQQTIPQERRKLTSKSERMPVDCTECEMGWYGDKSCETGWHYEKPHCGGCFGGTPLNRNGHAKPAQQLNVYHYSLWDAADQKVYSALTTGADENEVLSDICGNYRDPHFVEIRQVENLIGVYNRKTDETVIRPRWPAG